MRRLTFENSRGEKIVFYLSPLLIESLTGIGEVDANVQGQSIPFQDGDMYLDTKLKPRFINLEGSITTTDHTAIKKLRSDIIRVCNPKLGLGKITFELDGDLKQIYGTLDGVPAFPERGNNPYQKFLITWKCPNPYWKSPSITEEPAFEPRFHFPISGPFIFGVERTDKLIVNDGDAPAPIRIDFYGPAQQPYIENKTTGEFIKINKELGTNEVLKVDTENKTVIFVDESGEETNVFHWLDLSSTFFLLEVGENEISCKCAISENKKIFDVYYNKLYVGV